MLDNKVVAAEVVEAEWDRFVSLNEFDCDEKTMDKEELKEFYAMKRKILAQMVAGRLTIDADGIPSYSTFKTKTPVTITFYEPTGASMMAMDRKSKGQDVAKLFAAMGDMCQVDPKTFALMHAVDLKICMSLANLFLA